MERESLSFDAIIVGAGPAGLSAAIRLKQLANEVGHPLKIVVIEKSAEIGGHIISGTVLEPRALDELIPNWKEKGAPVQVAATQDEFVYLTQNHFIKLPTPPQMRNHGNYIISLGLLCRWLAKEAESLGVEIFPGFAATEIVCDEKGQVKGVATNAQGMNKQGHKTEYYQPGIELHAPYTLFAEGARGSLSKILCERFQLRNHSDPQTFGLGIKEIWEIDPNKHQLGKVQHSVGWPLDNHTYGGSFIYHAENNQLFIGFVVGLDYENPYLDPYEEFQRFKHHPYIKPLLQEGRRISYGARAINEGGFQSIPKLIFPGGALIGCAAGFLNVAKIKGNHTAMKSGMLAAESIFHAILQGENKPPLLTEYEDSVRKSWIAQELKQVRNIRPAFRWGLQAGLIYAGIDTYLLRGRAPWTFRNFADHLSLKKASQCSPIAYPKHDGKISFDKLDSVALSNIHHREDQLVHLVLKDPSLAISVNLDLYDSPEQRYCPAKVYEILDNEQGKPYLQINAANCVHCKTCDIKDPKQNITWVPPEGGSGPNYSNM